MELPERALWPLPPRVEVLPWPPPSPQPTRFLRCTAPGTFVRLWRRILVFPDFWAPPPAREGRLGVCQLGAESLEVLLKAELAQAVERGVDDGDVVLGAHRLGEDVVDARGLEDGADAAAGDQAGAVGGGTEEHLAAVVFAEDLVRDGAALELDGDHALLGGLGGFLDGVGDLVGLAVADADHALAVADDGKRGEAEAPAALDDLGAAVDEDHLLEHAGFTRVVARAGGKRSVVVSHVRIGDHPRGRRRRRFSRGHGRAGRCGRTRPR